MKNLILIVVAAGLGFAGAFLIVSKRNEAGVQSAQIPFKAEADKLKPENAGTGNHPVDNSPQPQDLLAKLAQLNPNTAANSARTVRLIIHDLESLVDAGNNAILPIREFLASGQDVSYVVGEGHPGKPFWDWHPGQALPTGLVLPPSLRLSLVDVLRDIGGEDAVTSLGLMLSATSSGSEVTYVSQVLERLAPGRYTDIATAAARKLLQNPPANGPAGPLDANANAYLYAMLGSRGDTSLVATAQDRLITQGHLDQDAARYLVSMLKEQALPSLAKAYPAASNEEKNKLVNLAFNYVGDSPDANQMFKDWILNNVVEAGAQTVNARPRALYVQMLGGGNFGPFHSDPPTDPQVIASRVDLLKQLDSQITEPRLKQAITQALQSLNRP